MKVGWLRIIFNALIVLFDIQQLHVSLFEHDDFHIERSEARSEQDSQREEAVIQMKDHV